MKLELPWTPPSTNQVYRKRGNSPGMYMTDEGRNFKEQLGWLAKAKWGVTPSKKPMMMKIVLEFSDKRVRDVNNYDKLLFDALEGICYENDSQVVDLHITKSGGYKIPRTIISLQEIR